MEKPMVLKTGKYISIVVMLLSAVAVIITSLHGFLTEQSWGEVVIALGVFLISVRNFLKDKYGMI